MPPALRCGDVVEYVAVDPAYNYLTGHVGVVTHVEEGRVELEYTIAWFTSMAAAVAPHMTASEVVEKGWRGTVLRYLTHLDVPV